MYCRHIIYIIYVITYEYMCEATGISGGMEGNAYARKKKNKRQGTMTKGVEKCWQAVGAWEWLMSISGCAGQRGQ